MSRYWKLKSSFCPRLYRAEVLRARPLVPPPSLSAMLRSHDIPWPIWCRSAMPVIFESPNVPPSAPM